MLDLITVDLQDAARETVIKIQVGSFVSQWDKATADKANLLLAGTTVHLNTPAELGRLERAMTLLSVAFPLLSRRNALNYRRSSMVVDAGVAQVLGFSIIIITLFWAPWKSNYEDVQGRLGFVQQQMGE